MRARLLADIRSFFHDKSVLEVETPLLSKYTTSDPNIDSLEVSLNCAGLQQSGKNYYLQTSPEYAMKRLLAAGSDAIFQICKVFRNGEAGSLHNPEFTMLEWYQPGYGYFEMMDEVELLVSSVLGIAQKFERMSYQALFQHFVDINPHRAEAEALQACAAKYIESDTSQLEGMGRDAWLHLILTHVIEPELKHHPALFVYDFPVSQAALAAIRQHALPPVAERFELYLYGVELANGYHECCDAGELLKRFGKEQSRRKRNGQNDVKPDLRLLSALKAGLPDCAGVAVGIDRLLMIMAGVERIDDVLAFPISRA